MAPPDYIYTTVIAAPAKKVWDALTLPEFTRQYWHDADVTSDWKPGAPVRFLSSEGEIAMDGELLTYEPYREMSYSWTFPRMAETAGEDPSRVTFLLEEQAGMTRLTIRHDRFPEDSNMPGLVTPGWPLVIAGLKTLLETGRAVKFWRMHPSGEAAGESAKIPA